MTVDGQIDGQKAGQIIADLPEPGAEVPHILYIDTATDDDDDWDFRAPLLGYSASI